MDPTQSYLDLHTLVSSGRHAEAARLAEALLGWLERGGEPPIGLTGEAAIRAIKALRHETEGAAAPDRQGAHARITARIAGQLRAGVRPWRRPWTGGAAGRPLRSTGEPYRGINTVLLWLTALERGYASPWWFTFRQALSLGARVRRGERGTLVVYASSLTRRETDEQGREVERAVPFLKGYTVFNGTQIDGLPERFREPAPAPKPLPERLRRAEAFFAATGAGIREGGGRAFYRITEDFIGMPPRGCFESAEAWAATLAHELVHWTRHPVRLDRDLGRRRWGDAGYAAEEMVAELGAAFLCADLGIDAEPREDHAAYIAGWLELLERDVRALFVLSGHAQRAADFLWGLQPKPGTDGEGDGR
jgi:antirestriction protein ArdC